MATNGIVQVAQAAAAAAVAAAASSSSVPLASSSSSATPNGNISNGSTNTSNGNNANNVNAKHQMALINAISQAFRNQMGEPMQNDKIASLLLQHMGQLGELAKQGKLNYAQIMQVGSVFVLFCSVIAFLLLFFCCCCHCMSMRMGGWAVIMRARSR